MAKFLGLSRQAIRQALQGEEADRAADGASRPRVSVLAVPPERTLAGLEDVLDVLRRHDAWSRVIFMLSPNDPLDGATPLEALRKGRTEEVRAAAALFGALVVNGERVEFSLVHFVPSSARMRTMETALPLSESSRTMREVPALPKHVRVVEVGPRDGLQNELDIVPLDAKVAIIEALADAGLSVIEVGSFVRPDRVPQMADTEEVVRRLRPRKGTTYVALVANRRGLERALASGVRTIAVFTAASEAFAQVNIGMRIDESLARFRDILVDAARENVSVRGYVSTAWWCPYSGRVNPGTVRRVALTLLEIGCAGIALGDTIGAATPAEVQRLLEWLLREIPAEKITVHFHDTRGTGLANVLASMEAGISTIDASAGGLGGCPFAPGALGNVATEDLLYMLHGMGCETGVSLEKVCAASREMQKLLGRPLPSRYLHAGPVTLQPPASR